MQRAGRRVSRSCTFLVGAIRTQPRNLTSLAWSEFQIEMTTTFSPPTNDYSSERPSFQVRRRAACSLVKRRLLGKRHCPSQAQQTAMKKAMRQYVLGDKEFQPVTWRDWWSGKREIRGEKLALLDRASGEAPGFIQELVLGGSKDQPFSPLHGHFDALDAAGYFGRKNEDWENRRRQMSLATLGHLHRKWRPNRNRQVPAAFPKSRIKVQYEALATDKERDAFVNETAGKHKAFFKVQLDYPDPLSEPVFHRYDPQSPACMPAFLFAVGHDAQFLSEEKLDTWAWDLATASLSLWGLLFADRYDSVLGGQREYGWLWSQLYALFWMGTDEHSFSEERDFLLYVAELQHTAENEEVLDIFSRARNSYMATLHELGLVPSDIQAIFDRPWEERPVIFRPPA